MRAGVLPRFPHALRQTERAPYFRRARNRTCSRGGVTLMQRSCLSVRSWLAEGCTSLGRRIAAPEQTGLHANASGVNRFIPPANKNNFKNHKFMNRFKSPSPSGRVFFRLYAQGQAAPLFKQQFVYATL